MAQNTYAIQPYNQTNSVNNRMGSTQPSTNFGGSGPFNPNPTQPPAPTTWGNNPTQANIRPGNQSGPVNPDFNAWFRPGQNLGLDQFADENQRNQISSWLSSTIPLYQMRNNIQQYQQDFGENQRRWDQEFGRNTANDQWSQNMAGRQQTQAELQAQRAYDQWNQQFAHQQGLDQFEQGLADRRFGLDETNANRQWEMSQNRFGLDQQAQALQELQNQQQYGLQEQRFGLDQQTANRDWQMANNRFGLDQEMGRGNLALNQLIADRDYQLQQGDQRLNQQRFGLEQQTADRNFQIAQGAQDIDRAYREGLISNEQRNLALQELQNSQQYNLANRQFGLEQANSQFANRLAQQRFGLDQQTADRQFGLQAELGRGNLALDQQRLGLERVNANRDYELARGAQDIDRQYRQGLISNEQRNLALQELAQQQQFGLAQQQFRETQAQNQRQFGLQQQAQNIDAMWRSGQLSNQDRELALQELAQQQQFGLQGQRLGIEQGDFGLRQQQQQLESSWRDRDFILAQQRMAQEGQLAREQMANQEAIARWNQFGRNQAPTAKWINTF